jgi:Predicted helicase
MTSIFDILDELRREAESQRDLGNRFERLMQAYFQTDPYYQDLFSHVWLWMEYPNRGDSPDVGIDLVAKERATGELWAIQCKFYHPDHTLTKKDVDSFLAASGKKEFSHRLIVSTTDKWSDNLEKAIKNQQVPVKRLTVYDLAQ